MSQSDRSLPPRHYMIWGRIRLMTRYGTVALPLAVTVGDGASLWFSATTVGMPEGELAQNCSARRESALPPKPDIISRRNK